MGNKNNVLTEAEIIALREKISNVLALEEMKKSEEIRDKVLKKVIS